MFAKRIQRLLLGILLGMSTVAYSDVIRDYYAEPGISPFKESLNQNFNESISPFSGQVTLSNVDLKIPGNGGLDIDINRIYNSVQDDVGVRSINGIGWTMHFGRIVVADTHVDKVCNQGLWSVSVINNPSLELPDGGRELLFLADDPNAYLITRSRWKAACDGASRLIVTAPNGTVYTMDQFENNGAEVSWYTSRIEDTNGNWIDISYKTGAGFSYIDQVTASDGRLVQFNYEFEGTSGVRLASIVANNQTWEYHYTAVPELAGNYEQLTEVIRPDGKTWLYDYHPKFAAAGVAGSFAIKRVTYPYGATIDYTYKYFPFDPANVNLPTTVVDQKVVGGGPNVAPGTWTFDYLAGITINDALDRTTIQTPDSKQIYYHWGCIPGAVTVRSGRWACCRPARCMT